MKYAVVFDSKADAQKLLELMNTTRINAVLVEMFEDSFMETSHSAMSAMMKYCLSLEKTDSERKLAKLKADYVKAYTAFMQAPTPSMASVVKRMGAKVQRDSKKLEKQA
jgi:hypothetical protein